MNLPVRVKLVREFYDFDFFQAVRVLEKVFPDRKPVGLDAAPEEEVARFRAHLSLAFPPGQIVEFIPPSDEVPSPLLTVTFLGLYGPSGVLPTHYTQMLMDLVRDVRGPERRSLRDWLDIFNQRAVSLFYRAWEKYRFYIPYERGEPGRKEPDSFTLAMRSVIGLGSAGLRDRLEVRHPDFGTPSEYFNDFGSSERSARTSLAQIDDLGLLYYSGFFAQRPRNPTNLKLLLADYFGVPVEVQPFQGQWLALPESDQTQLGVMGVLGENTIAGSHVWDRASRFRLRLGPLGYDRFNELLPDRAPAPERKSFFLVSQLARLFVGGEYDFDIQLVLAAWEVPEVELADSQGAGPRLGWNTWLISDTPQSNADDAVFESDDSPSTAIIN